MCSSPRIQRNCILKGRETVTSILCNLTEEQRQQFATRANQAAQKQQRLASLAHQPHMLWQESETKPNSPATSYWLTVVAYLKKIWH
ncbi:hypothetical protein [Thalassotalea fusca]